MRKLHEHSAGRDNTRRATEKSPPPAPPCPTLILLTTHTQHTHTNTHTTHPTPHQHDNWAVLKAQELARACDPPVPVVVAFNLVPKFLEATARQYEFMLTGLSETERHLRELGIAFHLTKGDPLVEIPKLAAELNTSALVCDMSPLRVPMMWSNGVAGKLDADPLGIPVFQVDAHNIVPVWEASDKKEVGARTLRKKIHNGMETFFTEFPPLEKQAKQEAGAAGEMPDPVDWALALGELQIDRSVAAVDWCVLFVCWESRTTWQSHVEPGRAT